ncbi:MAG: hypothetical protein EZS28_008564, partial [Streblomastix strix]
MCVRQSWIIDTKSLYGTEGQDGTEKYKTSKVDGQKMAQLANNTEDSKLIESILTE